eukprot:scaffold96_cov302-Prasinococcus_capsulatus_cf.AAC.4
MMMIIIITDHDDDQLSDQLSAPGAFMNQSERMAARRHETAGASCRRRTASGARWAGLSWHLDGRTVVRPPAQPRGSAARRGAARTD